MNCKELGYKVGDWFEIIDDNGLSDYEQGDKVFLSTDDGSSMPWFKKDGNSTEHCVSLKKIRPLEKTMDIKEAYKIMSQNCGIKVGDTVKVLRGWSEKEYCPCAKYMKYMEDFIGREGVVNSIGEEWQIRVKIGDEERTWPFYVLEKVKDAEESIIIDGHVVEFKEEGKIKVGCQKIDFETIKKIYDRAKATL